MSSDKQISANRRNAQMSTGPTTPEGKARVGQNATKFGIYANSQILPGESEVDYQEVVHELEEELHPHGIIQRTLFIEIVADIWVLLRLNRAQRAYLLHKAKLAAMREGVTSITLFEGKPLTLNEEIEEVLVARAGDVALTDEHLDGALRLTANEWGRDRPLGEIQRQRERTTRSMLTKHEAFRAMQEERKTVDVDAI